MDRRRQGINKALSSHEQVPVNFCTEYISSVLRLTCCFHGIFCRSVFEITMKMKNKITTSHAFTFFFRVGSENIDPVRLIEYYLQRFIFKIYVRPTEPCNYKKHTIRVLSSQKPLLIISQYLKVHVERHAISTLTPVLVLDFFCEVA